MKIFDISENSPKQDFQKVFFTPKHYLKQYQNTLSPTPSPSAKGVCSHPTICSKKGQSNNSPFWQAKLANLAQLQIPPNARSHFSDVHRHHLRKSLTMPCSEWPPLKEASVLKPGIGGCATSGITPSSCGHTLLCPLVLRLSRRSTYSLRIFCGTSSNDGTCLGHREIRHTPRTVPDLRKLLPNTTRGALQKKT